MMMYIIIFAANFSKHISEYSKSESRNWKLCGSILWVGFGCGCTVWSGVKLRNTTLFKMYLNSKQ